MVKEDTHLLLLFSCLLCINPANGLDQSLMSMFARFRQLPYFLSIIVEGLTYLIVSLILVLGVQRMKKSIRNPVDVVLILYIVIMLASLQLALLYFVPSLFFWFLSYLLFEVVIELIGSLALIVCAQQTAKYCQEGYEGFSINLNSGIVNIAIIIGNYIGGNVVGSFLEASHFSQKSFNYAVILSFELALIPLLLAFYTFKLRN